MVDDAIVMLENIVRHVEEGMEPLRAALQGSREVGFTIISISISLVAVFIPIFFMPGVIGLLFHEFAVVVSLAILVSAVVSLTLVPMLASRFLHSTTARQNDPAALGALVRARLPRRCWRATRARSTGRWRTAPWCWRLPLGTFVADGRAVRHHPQGLLPEEDIGQISVTRRGVEDISFPAMADAAGSA